MSIEEWDTALSLFVADQRSRRIDESTISRRVRQVRRIGIAVGIGPWKATREHLLAATQELAAANSTKLTYRESLRAFYRWAHTSRRVWDDPTEEPSRRATSAPISPAWDAELRAYRAALRAEGIAETTIRVRLSQLRRFGRDHAHLSPWAVTLDDMLEWFGSKRWAKETRRGHRSAVRSFYRWGKATGRVKRNPAAKLPTMKSATPVPRPADMSDYDLALARADDRERLALRMAIGLGMRCGEVARAHGSDLRGGPGAWTLRVNGKGDKIRSLPVPDDLARTIRVKGNTWLFPGQIDGHLSAAYLGKRVNRVLPRGTTMHMLRHKFATDAYAITHDTFAVQRLLGHASPATTQRYVAIDDESLRDTVEEVHRRRQTEPESK